MDLGVWFTLKGNWNEQVAHVTAKANRRRYLMCKVFNAKNHETLKIILKSYIRPQIEYNRRLWCPYTKQSQAKLEKVVRKLTKQGSGLSKKSYARRLQNLGISSTKYRSLRGDLIDLIWNCSPSLVHWLSLPTYYLFHSSS